MIDVKKIIVFLFVIILLFYMIRLSFFTRRKWELRTYTFKVLFVGLLLLTIATFLDMVFPMIKTKFMYIFIDISFLKADNKYIDLTQFIYILIRICFTLGAGIYILGVILWGNYTKKVIGKFEEMALKDSMTEAFNRTGIEKVYKRVSQASASFYVIICDLDGMKKINDKYGHLQGDKYITSTVKIIIDVIGTKGHVARIGGDEFVIILEYQDTQQMQQTIFKIKQSVREIFPGKTTGISLGYSVFPNEGDTLEELIKVADEKMYNDKQRRKKETANI